MNVRIEDKLVLFCCVSLLVQNVIKKKLESEGFQVLLASDGNQATMAICERNPDLVVTEELLPFQSGYEIIKLCTQLDIPSIIISDADLENKIMEAFDMGAYDFIDKPYSPNELLVRIKSIFKHQLV